MKIVHVNYGIANRFPNHIEMNKHLLNYPNLYKSILKHELDHTNKAFTWHDLKHDLSSIGQVDNLQLMKFMFRHPASFSQLLPLYFTKKKGFVYDINLCLIWFFLILVFFSGIILGNVFN